MDFFRLIFFFFLLLWPTWLIKLTLDLTMNAVFCLNIHFTHAVDRSTRVYALHMSHYSSQHLSSVDHHQQVWDVEIVWLGIHRAMQRKRHHGTYSKGTLNVTPASEPRRQNWNAETWVEPTQLKQKKKKKQTTCLSKSHSNRCFDICSLTNRPTWPYSTEPQLRSSLISVPT